MNKQGKTILGFPRKDFLIAVSIMLSFWCAFVAIVVGTSPF